MHYTSLETGDTHTLSRVSIMDGQNRVINMQLSANGPVFCHHDVQYQFYSESEKKVMLAIHGLGIEEHLSRKYEFLVMSNLLHIRFRGDHLHSLDLHEMLPRQLRSDTLSEQSVQCTIHH